MHHSAFPHLSISFFNTVHFAFLALLVFPTPFLILLPCCIFLILYPSVFFPYCFHSIPFPFPHSSISSLVPSLSIPSPILSPRYIPFLIISTSILSLFLSPPLFAYFFAPFLPKQRVTFLHHLTAMHLLSLPCPSPCSCCYSLHPMFHPSARL
jgi:hypothetical protein